MSAFGPLQKDKDVSPGPVRKNGGSDPSSRHGGADGDSPGSKLEGSDNSWWDWLFR